MADARFEVLGLQRHIAREEEKLAALKARLADLQAAEAAEFPTAAVVETTTAEPQAERAVKPKATKRERG
jgi:hypothetical protein